MTDGIFNPQKSQLLLWKTDKMYDDYIPIAMLGASNDFYNFIVDSYHGEDEMGIKNDCRRNAEGYSDPTAYEALKNMEQEDERFHKLLDTIFALCELSDFHIEERIVIKDKRTGRIWR